MTQVNIAVVGLGFMGATHIQAWNQIDVARLHAVVSRDPRKLSGDLSGVGGNLGDAAGRFDFSCVRGYESLEEALADPAVDAIDICLPTTQHVSAATAALRAGKHVLLEKPMALDAASAESLIQEAKRHGRILMTAQVLRFFPAWQELGQFVRDNGPVHSAFFRRRCAAPSWSEWLTDPACSGGAPMDLLIHDADYCISLWRMPESVRARGYRDLARGIDLLHAELTWPKLGPVVITGGWHHKACPFSMEFTVVSDSAMLEWSSVTNDLRRYDAAEAPESLPLRETDAFVAELSYFANCVRTGTQPRICPPAQSAQAVALIEKMLESREKGGELVKC